MRLEDSAFDSQHYGLRISRLVREPDDGDAALDAALDAARRAGCDVVFLRLDERDALCDVLESRGHAPVDTLVTSTLGRERKLMRSRTGVQIEHDDRMAGGDVDAIAALTADTITTSHLHADPRLPIDKTRALYADWARNDVTGRAQRVLVARLGTELAGFMTVLLRGTTAVIDLIAVARERQGSGLGSAMLQSFIGWVDVRQLGATVGTQATNPALALYARFGFVPTEAHLTYHLWL